MYGRRTAEDLTQITLGELIQKLEAVEDKTLPVAYDFEYAYPTIFQCWRGSYAELALGWSHHGYQACDAWGKSTQPPVAAFLEECKSAVGQTFEGWKGGDFIMGLGTAIWVANPGNSGSTAIVDAVQKSWEVVLMTRYCEF